MMKHNVIQHWWSRLTGAQHILTTMVAEYRLPGTILEIFGQQYRVVHVDGVDVWGRPVWWRRSNAVCVQSPVKRQLYNASTKRAL
jgi:hypothetical protein